MLDFDLIIQLAPSQAPQIAICFLFWSLTTAIFFILMQKAEVPIKCKWQYCSALLLALLTTATYCQQENSLVKFIQMFQLAQAKEVKQLKFSELRKFGISYSSVTKDDLKIVSKGNGKNIILIVLESMEKNFLDEELFPGLTPNLNRLKNSPDSLFFELDNSASCTADAIFQMLYGMPTTPLTIPSSGVGPANIPTLKKFVSLPNIFINAGYSWSHIEQLCSLSELLSQDKVFVGFRNKFNLTWSPQHQRDYYTFDCAWKEFQEKTKEKSPFVLSMVSLDGHFPNGFVSEKTMLYPNKGKFPSDYKFFQLLNANFTTDFLLGELVKKIQDSPEYKNTVIAIANDHLLMGANTNLRKKNPRKNFLLILNSGKVLGSNTEGCQLDIPQTLLDIAEIKSNYVFPCSRSLVKPTPTLPMAQRLSIKTQNGLTALNNLISYKKQQTSKAPQNSNKISCSMTDSMFFINCFGKTLRIQLDRLIFSVALDKNDNIASAGLPAFAMKDLKILLARQLKDNSPYIFVFYGSTELSDIILDRFDIAKENVEYALVYKHSNGNMQAVFSNDLNSLNMNIAYIKNFKETGITSYTSLRKNKNYLSPDLFYVNGRIDVQSPTNFVASGAKSSYMTCRRLIHCKKNDIFEYSAKVKNTGTAPVTVHYAFRLFDKDNGWLNNSHFPLSPKIKLSKVINSDTKHNKITVSGKCSGWRIGNSLVINAKEDYSDVPNKNNIGFIKAINPLNNGNTEITLTRTNNMEIPVGCLLRPHGGNWYTFSQTKQIPPGESVLFSGNMLQKSKNVFYTSTLLPEGIEKVSPFILILSSKDTYQLEFSDFKFQKR